MRTFLLSLCSLTFACTAPDFRSALPTRDAVAINVPGATVSTSSARTEALLGTQGTFYTMTREISTQLNGAAASFFGQIDIALATPPSAHDASHEYWGPFTEALSPMTIELAVEKVDAHDYNFFLGGKPKGAADSAYMGLLGGSSHQAAAGRVSGMMQVNFTEMNALDPTVNRSTGIIAFVHDNTADPRTVDVHFADFLDGSTAGATPLNADYQYTEHPDTSGTFAFALMTNFDNDKNNALEQAVLFSRWVASGAGRSDMVVQGGSLPAGFMVHAIECWDASFLRVYYTEDVDPTKTEGSASACAIQ
jgi:hypothetical protein